MAREGEDESESVDLVRRAQGGESEAFERLLDRYYDRVRRIVRGRLGGKLRGELESGDILQDTFLAAVRAFDRFEVRDEDGLIHWLAKIAERQIRDAADYHGARKRDARRKVPLHRPHPDGESDLVHDPSAHVTPPLEGMVHDEDVRTVELALEELRPRYREVIVHRDYTGASWSDVASALGLETPDAARVLYARALTELASIVKRREH